MIIGFALLVAMTVVVGAMAIYSLQNVAAYKDDVIDYNARNLTDAQRLDSAVQQEATAYRAYFMTGNEGSYQRAQAAETQFQDIHGDLIARVRTGETQGLLQGIADARDEHNIAQARLVTLLEQDVPLSELFDRFDETLIPLHRQVTERIQAFEAEQQAALEAGIADSNRAVTRMTILISIIAALAALLALIGAIWLTRRLSGQIENTIYNVRSSSAQLEAAANEQASGAKQQSSAMKEISTTMNELLSTSRQIAESARQVADIAEQTEGAADNGEQSVRDVAHAVTAIGDQVDLIVEHMLELGDKSQRIGGILRLIDEFSEQTNILAINATIEAAGAGDAGRRFGVVAEEIRKLSDRVGNSTGQIRLLVDEIQEAVNTTVMATEGGAKAVKVGQLRFSELNAAFTNITQLVETTTEAAQEIELSTTQQTSAVEQVNAAINDVAQAAREAETATSQTLQTASELAFVSDEMGRLIEAQRKRSAADRPN